jgi:hypothetical protein
MVLPNGSYQFDELTGPVRGEVRLLATWDRRTNLDVYRLVGAAILRPIILEVASLEFASNLGDDLPRLSQMVLANSAICMISSRSV